MPEQTAISLQAQTTPAAVSAGMSQANAHEEQTITEELIRLLPIQRKLTVGADDDPMEREADAMADRVIRRMETPFTVSQPETQGIRRKCQDCPEEETIREKPINTFIQKKGAKNKDIVDESITGRIHSLKGSGSPLPEHAKKNLGNGFGTDFSNVRVHSGSDAAKLAGNLNAQAFTVGNDIFFNSGRYDPVSSAGKYLLAHELTHTIQQGGNSEQVSRQKDTDAPFVNYVITKPSNVTFGMVKTFLDKTAGNIDFDYFFLITGDDLNVFSKNGFEFEKTFDRKSSPNLSGYFVNVRTETKTFWGNEDSWHVIVELPNGSYEMPRLVTYFNTYTQTHNKDLTGTQRYNLSKQLFDVLQDLRPLIDLTKLSTFKDYNNYNIAVVIKESTGTGLGRTTKPTVPYIYNLPPWFSQLQKSVQEMLEENRKLNPDDEGLPTRLVFYGSTAIQAKEGEDVWMIQVERGKEKRFIKVTKRQWEAARDREDFARAIVIEIMRKTEQIKKDKKAEDFDKRESEENKLKDARDSKWAPLFKLRNTIWDSLMFIKKTNPYVTDIPDKLTLEFFGEAMAEKPYFKVWIEHADTEGKKDWRGSMLDLEATESIPVDMWIMFIRKHTTIQRLIDQGVDPFEFMSFDKKDVDPDAPVQLAPFPAEINGKNINPDFSTAKGASNDFVMSLNWDAIYGLHTDLEIASRISQAKQYYNFQLIFLPDDLKASKDQGTNPDNLKKESTDYVKKNKKILTPFAKNTSIGRHPDFTVNMDDEGAFLLVSYASVVDEKDKLPRAISIAAHPFFVKDIRMMAEGFAEGMDVVDFLKKKLSAEKNEQKRKALEDQIRDIETRQLKGYAVQAREDMADIDKLISQAKKLIEYTEQQSYFPAYFGDIDFDPFVIRLTKNKPDLVPIYNTIKGSEKSVSYSDDIAAAQRFINGMESQKSDLAKLARRVENPQGKFKSSAPKYKALAAAVNEDNGRIVPVMLLIGEHVDSKPEKNEYKHIIYDVTVDSYKPSDMLYVGEGTESTREESVRSAFVKFGEKNNYGDGKVAYRVPAMGYQGIVRSYTTVWEWIEKALMVLALVLLAFGVILSGGALAPAAAGALSLIATSLGVSVGILGAIIAIRNILGRREKGTLKMDAETKMDILNIIGAFTGGLTTIGTRAAVKISSTLIMVYDVAEVGANLYLVHEKLEEDVKFIKSMNLSLTDEKALMEQASAEAEQSGAMVMGMAVSSKISHVGGKEQGTPELPDKLKAIAEGTDYKSFKQKGWVDQNGKVSPKAPPYLRELAAKATPEKTVTTEPHVKDEPAPVKPKTPVAEKPSIPKEEPVTVKKSEGIVEKPVRLGEEDHEVMVSKDGVSLCSDDPCTAINLEYKAELDSSEELRRKYKEIQDLRTAGKYEEAATKAVDLVKELEAVRAKTGESTEPGQKPAEPVTAKTTEPSKEPGVPPKTPTLEENIIKAEENVNQLGDELAHFEKELEIRKQKFRKAGKKAKEEARKEMEGYEALRNLAHEDYVNAKENATNLRQEKLSKSVDVAKAAEEPVVQKIDESRRKLDKFRRQLLEELDERHASRDQSEIERLKQKMADEEGRLNKHYEEFRERQKETLKRVEALQAEQRAAIGITEAEYADLRSKSPSDTIRKKIQKILIDAVYDVPIQGTPEADHIVSMNEITQMKGFAKLRPDQKLKILNMEENFMPLDKRVNSSKGDRSFSEWEGYEPLGEIDPVKRESLLEKESFLRKKIQEEIDKLVPREPEPAK
jgi:uncharacterized protein YecT (DUF1311 family)